MAVLAHRTAFVALFAFLSSAAQAQDGSSGPVGDLDEVLDASAAFEQMPTSELLDLYNDVGLVLQKRKLLPEGWNPAQDYAEILVVKALRLTRSGAGGLAEGSGGVKFKIIGAHPRGADEPVRLTGLTKLDFDRLAIVVFGDRFIIDRAVVAPKDVIATKISGGNLVLTTEILGHAGLEDVTAKVDRFTGDEF